MITLPAGVHNAGLWVAILGPDGAGKSAVIERLKSARQFPGMLQGHFRPRLGRGVDHAPVVTTPHAKEPRGGFATLLKLTVWLVDYWHGYLTMVVPAVRSRKLVVFDRYYHDVLVDPRRYRIPHSSSSLARWFRCLVPQPELFIVLDVPAEILQARKPEVSRKESERQRAAYRKFSAASPKAVLVNADRASEEVAREVSSILLNFEASHVSGKSGASLIANS